MYHRFGADFRRPIAVGVLTLLAATTVGCSIPALLAIFGQTPGGNTPAPPAISVAVPNSDTNVNSGVGTLIRWADVAPVAGTTVNVVAQKRNAVLEDVGDPITLVTNRDAQLDGTDDTFTWDVTGVRVGNYTIIATITAPDGRTADDESNGRFVVTTTLTVPNLTFTNPAAADVNFTAPGPLNITWTDNGSTATTAKVKLGLDLNFNHTQGSEIILAENLDLSADGNTGTFAFTGVDKDGVTVPAGSYVVFAILDDTINEIVTKDATGKLIVP